MGSYCTKESCDVADKLFFITFTGASGYTGAYFREGSGPIHLDYVVCSGTEFDLVDCEIRDNTRQSSHSEDVGVKCQTSKGTRLMQDIYIAVLLPIHDLKLHHSYIIATTCTHVTVHHPLHQRVN